jgi:hypothetical protein
MAYSIKVNPGSLTITFSQEPDSNVMVDMVRSLDKAMSLLDDLPEPGYLIIDYRRVSLDVDDHLRLSSVLALGPNPVAHHPNVIEMLFVSADPAVRMATAGLANPAFGGVKLSQFQTIEEALDYCHERLGRVRSAADDPQARTR